MSELHLSIDIENLLVSRNLRHMQLAQAALQPGYYLRAAQVLRACDGCVLIGTGFPVADTFETDGPVGAIALYEALSALGAEPVLVCAPPLATALEKDFRVHSLSARSLPQARQDALDALSSLAPNAVISIERPGLCADGRYYNMRGEDISARCGIFDPFVELAQCPTIAIGDGGNEIGMGKIAQAISSLDIRVSVTSCDELLVADVSNWGAYGLIAFLGLWARKDLLGQVSPKIILDYLSIRGSVDGVTRENTPTEDGLAASTGCEVIEQLRQLTGFASS